VKALILGAGGQVGRALAATAPEGLKVTALLRDQCDLSDVSQVAQAIRAAEAEVVFNAAAYTAVDRAESEPGQAEALNARAPGQIAAIARANGARLIHLSTDFVFDGQSGRPYRPNDPVSPLGVYGRSKAAGEAAVAAADPSALIVRTAWVYAPAGANFVNTMLRLMRERERIQVVSDQIGTPTWAPALARTLWQLAGQGASGLHHVTDGGLASWYDFAVAIEEEGRAAGLLVRPTEVVPIGTADYPTPARRPACSVLDKSLTWALLGERAQHWRVNLRANFEELRSHG
jgi:dTDP-4-dehydrorhamnose reductase